MIDRRLTSLEKLFSTFQISSGDGVTVSGNIHFGLAINTSESEGGAAEEAVRASF